MSAAPEPDSMEELCVYAMMVLPEFDDARLTIEGMWALANQIAAHGPQTEEEQRIFAEATALRLEGDKQLKARLRGDFG